MERKVKKRCYNDLEDATATEIVSLSSGDSGLWIGEEEWECEGLPVGNANGRRWECEGSVGMRSVSEEEWETKSRRVEEAKFDGKRVGEQSTVGMWRIGELNRRRWQLNRWRSKGRWQWRWQAQVTATRGELRRRRHEMYQQAQQRRAGFGGESEGKRENQVSEEKNGKWNKKNYALTC